MTESTVNTVNFHAKLVKIQSKLKVPKGRKNNFGNFAYRSCEDIEEALKPLLEKEGMFLMLTDELEDKGGRVFVKAAALISDGNQSIIAHGIAEHATEKKGMDVSQVTGAASSYARKRALAGLFLIDDTEDADADEPIEDNEKAPAKAKAKATPKPKNAPEPKKVPSVKSTPVEKAVDAKAATEDFNKTIDEIEKPIDTFVDFCRSRQVSQEDGMKFLKARLKGLDDPLLAELVKDPPRLEVELKLQGIAIVEPDEIGEDELPF